MQKNEDAILILSGGSARGLAHIGVLEAVSKRYNIRSIIGTSMGAIIGGLFAYGYKPSEILDIVKDIKTSDFISLLKFDFKFRGILNSEAVIDFLRKITNDADIENLKIKFAAVSFDLVTNKSVLIDRGALASALRASSSLPVFFSPYKYGSYLFIDGYVEYPLPLKFANHYHKDVKVIAASVFPTKPMTPEKIDLNRAFSNDEDVQKLNVLESFMQSSLMNQAFLALGSLIQYKPDVYISAYTEKFSFFDFSKFQEFYKLGFDSTERFFQENSDKDGKSLTIKRFFDDLTEHWESLGRRYFL